VDPEPPKEFRANHPFLLMLQDDVSDAALFVGQISSAAV